MWLSEWLAVHAMYVPVFISLFYTMSSLIRCSHSSSVRKHSNPHPFVCWDIRMQCLSLHEHRGFLLEICIKMYALFFKCSWIIHFSYFAGAVKAICFGISNVISQAD